MEFKTCLRFIMDMNFLLLLVFLLKKMNKKLRRNVIAIISLFYSSYP